MQEKQSNFLRPRKSKAFPGAENSQNFLAFAIKLAKESTKILQRMQNKAKIVKQKGKGDFALNADNASEQYILKEILRKYPHHDILTEETGHHHQKSDYLWMIDPLEGTLNYAHHLPLWAVNIGLFHKGKPFVGVIYIPMLKELFYAEKRTGAYLNGKKIHVNNDSDLLKTFIAITTMGPTQIPISGYLLRGLGCAGLELAYVACGRFGAKIKPKGNDPYGYGASTIIIQEAGGKVTDLHGKPWNLNSNGAIASNGKLHDKLLKMLSNIS